MVYYPGVLKGIHNNVYSQITGVSNKPIFIISKCSCTPTNQKIVPILTKEGHKQTINRPIAYLPVISKIYEKIICNRLNAFLESKKILFTN